MKTKCYLGICLVLTAVCFAQTESNQTEYLAVFLDGKKVGHAVQSRVAADGKVTTTESVNITLSRAGISTDIKMVETCVETLDARPLGFMSIQALSMMVTQVVGVVDERGMVEIMTTSMGSEQKSRMQWPNGAIMSEGLRRLMLKNGLKETTTYNARIFSPGMMQALDAEIRIGPKQNVDLLGRVATLTEVVTTMQLPSAGEIVNTSYVDDDLRAQKSIVPIAGMMMEMIACSKEFALGQNETLELVDKMFIASPQPLDNIGSIKAVSYHLKPTSPKDNLMIPSTDNQKTKTLPDGSVIVVVRPVTSPAGARFPYRGTDETILEATEPTRFLQSDRKEIIELARRAVGDTKNAADAVKKIEAFVAGYVENKTLSIGYASAAEVAAGRQGDCSEFAVLTAAMCRSLGIPARVVMGIAYVGDFAGLQAGFGGHAWVEACVGDRWVGLDAAFKATGRGGFDAGHIAQAVGNGDPEDFFNLVSTFGQFEIDKIIVSED